jgi:Tfp pilus assembly protein PilX
MKKRNITKEKGFTLVLSLFLSTIVLTITLSMMQILYKQLTLSTADRESQIAFFSADSGMECAYYWDFRADISGSTTQSIFQSVMPLGTPLATLAPTCGGKNIFTTVGPTGEPAFSTSTSNAAEDITIFYMTNINGTQACNYVIVKKNKTTATTTIESHGQNRCILGDPRRVERAIQFRY